MSTSHYVARVVNLIPAASQRLWSMDAEDASRRLLAGDLDEVLAIDGSFALVAQDGERVLPGAQPRPADAVLPGQGDGRARARSSPSASTRSPPSWPAEAGAAQFHPSYTRMVPAHHVTTLRLIGCPDPNPVHRRFFDPPRGTLPADLDLIGRRYIEATVHGAAALAAARRTPPRRSAFRSRAGSTAARCSSACTGCCSTKGQSPARLKAFTLSVDGGGADALAGARLPRPHGSRDARRDDRRRLGATSTRCAPSR